MVTAELAGDFEAPLYGMLAVAEALDERRLARGDAEARDRLNGQPEDESRRHAAVGRRMGGDLGHLPRHGRGLRRGAAGIYILVVAQFGSFKLPLVILTPIPLTFIWASSSATGCSARRSRPPR
jgi:hypothetical protein